MSLLADLRAQTRAEHESIEAVVPLMDPALTLQTYRRYLAATLGFYSPIETQLMQWRASLPDAEQRFHTPALERDLEALGATLPVALCTELPAVQSEEDALGVFYVLEGSTLGGQILLRQVGKVLSLDASNGAAFLASGGADIGPLWKRFCAYAEERASCEGFDAERSVQCARQTFVSLRTWLERALAA